jgi:hypothetical protein
MIAVQGLPAVFLFLHIIAAWQYVYCNEAHIYGDFQIFVACRPPATSTRHIRVLSISNAIVRSSPTSAQRIRLYRFNGANPIIPSPETHLIYRRMPSGEHHIVKLCKGMDMASNQKSDQKSGQGNKQSDNAGTSRQTGNKGSGSSQGGAKQSGTGTRGGTPEQHAEAGRQSHKNDDKR